MRWRKRNSYRTSWGCLACHEWPQVPIGKCHPQAVAVCLQKVPSYCPNKPSIPYRQSQWYRIVPLKFHRWWLVLTHGWVSLSPWCIAASCVVATHCRYQDRRAIAAWKESWKTSAKFVRQHWRQQFQWEPTPRSFSWCWPWYASRMCFFLYQLCPWEKPSG